MTDFYCWNSVTAPHGDPCSLLYLRFILVVEFPALLIPLARYSRIRLLFLASNFTTTFNGCV